jgi:hypothetical protein
VFEAGVKEPELFARTSRRLSASEARKQSSRTRILYIFMNIEQSGNENTDIPFSFPTYLPVRNLAQGLQFPLTALFPSPLS